MAKQKEYSIAVIKSNAKSKETKQAHLEVFIDVDGRDDQGDIL